MPYQLEFMQHGVQSLRSLVYVHAGISLKQTGVNKPFANSLGLL